MSMHQPPSQDALAHAVREVLPQVRAAWLFGSAAQGRFRPGSDLDIAVDVARSLPAMERWDAAQRIARRFGVDVDLLDFRRISTVMQYQVLATGTLLFDRDPAATAGYAGFVLSEYQNIQQWRQPMVRQLARRMASAGAAT